MKKIYTIIFLILILNFSQAIASDSIYLIDLPTSTTLLRGYFDVYFDVYNNGGIQTKISIGLTDKLTLGISEDIGGAIGDNKADWSIPGVSAKLNIVSVETKNIGWSFGYDSFINGEYGKVIISPSKQEIAYGIYTVISKPISLFGAQQSLHIGLRYPLLPPYQKKNFKNLGGFFGFNIPLNPEMSIMFESQSFQYDFAKPAAMLYNLGFKYAVSPMFSIYLKIQYTPSNELNSSNKPSRLLAIEYQNLFY